MIKRLKRSAHLGTLLYIFAKIITIFGLSIRIAGQQKGRH